MKKARLEPTAEVMDGRMLDREEAADWLRVGIRTLDALLKDGAIPAVRVRRRVLIDPDDLRRYIAAQKS